MSLHRISWILALVGIASLVPIEAKSAELIEEVVFANSGVSLSGAIHFPVSHPMAGIVLVHGSAKKDSVRMTALARLLAERGFAVLTYDKRGIGKSTGVFQDEGDERAFTLLAEDSVAGFQVLAAHPRMANIPSGLLGISQGGWVGPIAASQLPSASFMVLWSGPVCTVAEEMQFSAFARKIANFSMRKDRARVREHMKSSPARAGSFDPRPILSGLSLPTLWIFGERDSSIPVDLSIERLQEMIDDGRRNFEFQVFPEQAHGLDYPTPHPEGFECMVDWIERAAKRTQQIAACDRV
jgi:pimeloyl-ACP methyl ester carboxylesterase